MCQLLWARLSDCTLNSPSDLVHPLVSSGNLEDRCDTLQVAQGLGQTQGCWCHFTPVLGRYSSPDFNVISPQQSRTESVPFHFYQQHFTAHQKVRESINPKCISPKSIPEIAEPPTGHSPTSSKAEKDFLSLRRVCTSQLSAKDGLLGKDQTHGLQF